MRTIEFRARCIKSDKLVFGLLSQNENGTFFINGQEVKPATISQLIAIDKNGNQIFEHDKVIRVQRFDDTGKFVPVLDSLPGLASFRNYGAIIDGEIVLYKKKLVIKFRGISVKDNTYIAGDLISRVDSNKNVIGYQIHILEGTNHIYYDIKMDSIERLVGYDNNGNEVYKNIFTEKNDTDTPQKLGYSFNW